jgi:hypothetical protein
LKAAVHPAKVRLKVFIRDLFSNIERTMRNKIPKTMIIRKVFFAMGVLCIFSILVACGGPKPYYKTRVGKKKQKYYNEIQFGGKSAAEMKPVKTKKK